MRVFQLVVDDVAQFKEDATMASKAVALPCESTYSNRYSYFCDWVLPL